ncbi:efflux RND transporter periplasmic adaptor subunit [Flavobacterium ardleyense]|uniref:efflux RND transporter periplasmic adaptor subunit n=1 Tax=Flavobacterium ardleyense TaxID=2038737 RepID=UPI00298D44DA|nr:efflux RND transporter periplasmic adaptor subunit [Flavobacterium ardleyense]
MKRITLAFSTVALFIIASCGNKNEQQQMPPSGPPTVPVIAVEKTDALTYQTYAANLEGQQNVEIRPKVNGFIQKIYVDEGQMVKKGQLLFKLETAVLNQEANAGRAVVNAAQVEVNRLKPLVERKIISEVVLETAKAKLAQAKSTFSSTQASIGYGTITSPVDGVVGSIPFKEGSLASATSEMPLTTVSDTRNMRAYFSLNEKQLLQFNKNFAGANTAEKLKNVGDIELTLVDNSIYNQKGTIETINGSMNAATGSTEFRAKFANPEGLLRNGSSGEVRIPVMRKDIMLIPQTAVFDVQGKQMVLKIGAENKVESTVIKIDGSDGENFIVIEGLAEGDQIVTAGVTKLRPGTQVVPENKSTKEAAAAKPVDSTKTTK